MIDATVHILKFGFPLCEFTKAIPRDWPPQNYWVSVYDQSRHNRVNCEKCKQKLKTERPDRGVPRS